MDFVDESLLRRAADHSLAYLRSLPERHVGPRATRGELLKALQIPLPAEGTDPAAVIDELAALGERGTMATAGPRFFGFVIGGSLPVSVAADWLTGAWDQNAGIYAASPVASVAEDVARQWLLDLFELPRESGLGFVTGCQMANLTCLAAARNAVLREAGWDVEQDGLQGAPPVTVIAGAEAHITIYAALRMLGLGARRVVHIPTDSQGRAQSRELARLLAEVKGPAIVCAQAGNVNSGAFDPIEEMASIARDRKAWLHVDGAFGLWARVSRRKSSLAAGVQHAHSWATDAHKWLNVPYDCGVAIVRDAQAHRAAMTSAAAYLVQTAGEERDAVDWTPEFSRRARGLTVYAALRYLGRERIEEMIDGHCRQAARFAELLAKAEGVRILNEVVLNQVLVRFGDSDELTREVIRRVQQDGTCWLGGTTWHGMAAMRISISNWATQMEDVERSAAAILRCLKAAQS